MSSGNGGELGPHRDIVVIGASAGGLAALREIVGTLPGNLPAAVFVTMHSAPESGSRLADLLSRWGPLAAHIAVHGERIRPGQIYVAPNDNHLTLQRDFVRVTRGPKENGHRPAVDPLFRTAARMYANRVVGVILTGRLTCGTEGLLAIKASGGVAVVQSDAEFPGMPQSAAAHVEIDHLVPLREISGVLRQLVTEPIPEQAEEEATGPHTVAPQASQIVCPSCQGAMVESVEAGLLRYRCHVGHAFGIDSLLAEQSESLEAALWASVRVLEESAQLADRLAASSDRRLSPRFRDKAAALRHHAALIQDVLLHGTTLDAEDTAVIEPGTLGA
ncbi:MAG TPA: chemotaxis protein CheB [Myxococcaceae bacterium]|nr:chemotaxis protein CheB [Myxococcaceae bacterium]